MLFAKNFSRFTNTMFANLIEAERVKTCGQNSLAIRFLASPFRKFTTSSSGMCNLAFGP